MQHFNRITERTSIPQVVQATICEREDGCDFTKNPAQGDPLTRPSRHVPAGRPPLGDSPNDKFPVSWEFAAMDAFTVCDRLNVNSAPWSLAYACWKWEGYNGFGYRAHRTRSPYVVGGSNLQQRGKYVADGVWDADHMDEQLGCLPVAMRMIELNPALSLGVAIVVASPSIIPAVSPVPTALGGGLTGARWVQFTLNLVDRLSPPLKVDGVYGRRTRAAVRSYQERHGLTPSGFVDDEFCSLLDAAVAAVKKENA